MATPLVRASTAPEVTRPGSPKGGKRRKWSGAKLHTIDTDPVVVDNHNIYSSPQRATVATPQQQSAPVSPAQRSTYAKRSRTAATSGPLRERGVWAEVAVELEGYDEQEVQKWNEQIDTLLVFAGLFSAVVTAFNVESYHQLRLDADEASKALLITISQQLAELPVALKSNITSSATTSVLRQIDSFEPGVTDIWINALWFSSLVCSLIAASLGILVKQWLQRYKAEEYSLARERMRVRQHRFEGLQRWKVSAIVSFLPLLLRTSLNLFFAGLIVFLFALNKSVAGAVSSLIGVWFLGYVLSLVLPAVFRDCPYKSPEAIAFFVLRRAWEDRTFRHWSFVSWSDNEESVKSDSSYDIRILARLDRIFGDMYLGHFIRECSKDFSKEYVIESLRAIISQRLRIPHISNWAILNTSRISKHCSETLISILLDTIDCLETTISDSRILQDTISWTSNALQGVTFLIRCGYWGSEEASFDKTLMMLLPKLLDISSAARNTFAIFTPMISVLYTRKEFHYAPATSVLQELLSTATMFMSQCTEISSLMQTAAVMLSLLSLVGPESVHEDVLKPFISTCDAVIFASDLPNNASESVRRDALEALEICKEKVAVLEAKTQGVCGELVSSIELCMLRIAVPQVGTNGKSSR